MFVSRTSLKTNQGKGKKHNNNNNNNYNKNTVHAALNGERKHQIKIYFFAFIKLQFIHFWCVCVWGAAAAEVDITEKKN